MDSLSIFICYKQDKRNISLLLGPLYAKNSNRYIITPCTFLKEIFFRNSIKKTSKSNPCTNNRFRNIHLLHLKAYCHKTGRVSIPLLNQYISFFQCQGSLCSKFRRIHHKNLSKLTEIIMLTDDDNIIT